MILRLYRKLGELAEEQLIVVSTRIIYLPSGEPQKLRIYLIDETILDVWVYSSGKYSYHWDRRMIQKGVYRFDNAPHIKWLGVKTYPDHFHYGSEENVIESSITKEPEKAIVQVLAFIKTVILKERNFSQ